MKRLWLLLLLLSASVLVRAQRKTENVILITLDGMRWQEVFTGAEKQLISKDFVGDSARLTKKFWDEDPAKRRELLMPFFWSVVRQQGQLYGNRNLGNKVNVSNNQWFSYPGYNEILTGFADNERIHSNDKFDNPNKTVLEFFNAKDGFKGKVAAFTTWDAFPFIINSGRSGVPVSSGFDAARGELTPKEKILSELMVEVPDLFDGMRMDAFTFNLGWEYLKKNRPRLLYFSFGETDDFAHSGKYDFYLGSANYTDGYIRKLWNWVQSTEGYKDKTTLIISTDHGRGHHDKSAWRHHGSKMPECDQIWIAVLGPDTPPLGEVKTDSQLYQNQIAKTIAAALGVNYTNERPVGEVIPTALKK